MTVILACASHLLIDLPLFGGPVLLLGGGVLYTTRRERRSTTSAKQPANRSAIASQENRSRATAWPS
jgi:hypothetical protein